MSIKWSALKLNDAMDMVEECINQAVEPLEQVRIIAREARNIANLPLQIDRHLFRIIVEIDRVIGGSESEQMGRLKAEIQSVRESLPDRPTEDDIKRPESGSQLRLAAQK